MVKPVHSCGSRLKRLAFTVATLTTLASTGCAQVNALKSKVGRNTSAVSAPNATPAAPPRNLSFSEIVNELQLGHYDNGEQDLQRFLVQHPKDRAARALLRQLTADPKQVLGARSRSYTVQAGDSYSSLAARYLGDAGAFLILARYNGSTNPSVLRAGETVQLPSSSLDVSPTSGSANAGLAASGDDTVQRMPSTQDEASGNELPEAKAARLQRESLSLLDQGEHAKAMTRLGEALAIDPKLKPAGLQAAALRDQLLASYHERAIVLYRDQQLNPAIALWDRILAINPHYEPAVIYRARALELKQRLNQI
ncbi:MAG: LysM domain-containing protein [Rhodanobacter sp.]